MLGGFALEGPDGAPVGRLSLRRAEAVLAVLAVARDSGCTRDRLIGLLWPDSDEQRGRHGLRDALHAIRRVLGPDVMLTGVGDTLSLNAAVVATDIQRFARGAVAAPADAVEAYGGPLLDGFHVDDAPEFEHWLDLERTRLFNQCQEAIAKLAVEAEQRSRWREAAQWWARALGWDPLNTRVVVRRMWALARTGDRANALLEAEAHRVRLRRELDLEPEPAFLEEIERVRRGEVGPPIFQTPTEGIARPRLTPKPSE